MEKNPKRVEAGKKLAEKNKKIKEFYTKNSKPNYPIIGVETILGGSLLLFLYKGTNTNTNTHTNTHTNTNTNTNTNTISTT